jgi:hypothetical protein
LINKDPWCGGCGKRVVADSRPRWGLFWFVLLGGILGSVAFTAFTRHWFGLFCVPLVLSLAYKALEPLGARGTIIEERPPGSPPLSERRGERE